MAQTNGVPSAVKSTLPFIPPNLQESRTPKRSKFGKFLELQNIPSILPLKLEVPRENSRTPLIDSPSGINEGDNCE